MACVWASSKWEQRVGCARSWLICKRGRISSPTATRIVNSKFCRRLLPDILLSEMNRLAVAEGVVELCCVDIEGVL